MGKNELTQGKILLLSLLADKTSLFYQIPADSIWIVSKVVIFDCLDASKQTVPINFTRLR